MTCISAILQVGRTWGELVPLEDAHLILTNPLTVPRPLAPTAESIPTFGAATTTTSAQSVSADIATEIAANDKAAPSSIGTASRNRTMQREESQLEEPRTGISQSEESQVGEAQIQGAAVDSREPNSEGDAGSTTGADTQTLVYGPDSEMLSAASGLHAGDMHADEMQANGQQVYIHVYTYVHIYVYIYMNIYIYTYIYTYTFVHTYKYIHMYIYT